MFIHNKNYVPSDSMRSKTRLNKTSMDLALWNGEFFWVFQTQS